MTKTNKTDYVSVIDSGVGGLSLIPTLRAVIPHEDVVYFGDAANAPYGERSAAEVREIVDGIVDRSVKGGAKAIVLACNTATSAAADFLREKYPVPIIGMEPALKPAAEAGDRPRVLVMATPLTVREGKLHVLYERLKDKADFVLVPCRGLVEAVERGEVEGDRVRKTVEDLLSPHLPGVDSVVLGCTHYVHLKGVIQSVVGEKVKLFDGTEGTARQTRRRLEEAGILRESGDGSFTLTHSSPDPAYGDICRDLLQRLI